jgi:hypothetical protein
VKPQWNKLILLGWVASSLFYTGCIGPQYTKNDLIVSGKPAPRIHGAHDPIIQAELTTNLWAPQPFAGSAAEVGTTLFKSAGIQGWKDYHMNAQATGIVLQHKYTSGPYVNMDMRLQSLMVNGVPIPVQGPKYMRVVIFLGDVSVGSRVIEETNHTVGAYGKLVWNCDGWFEIHPQKAGDVGLVYPRAKSLSYRR